MDAEEALQRVQCYYDLRQPLARDFSAARKTSPETDEQKNQVRDWYSYKRIIGQSAVPATSGKRSKMSASSYHIKARGSSEIIEEVCASAIHPLTLADALVREKDADILGKGQFGKVFRGSSDMHGEVAIKVMPDGAPTHEQSRLALEAVILRTMSGKRGFPTLYYDARQTIFGQKSDVLVMSLLGKPVESTLGTHGAEHSATVLKIGRDIIQCLRSLHGAGYIHNDIKPLNILFGVPGSDRQEDAHLLDFGTATCTEGLEDPDGCLVPVDETTTLTAGGGTPLYASLAQLEGRPTRPVDDIESLWYCLAFLEQGALPWQWEPKERVANIKRKLFDMECAISEGGCDSQLRSEEACSTAHCKSTYDDWDSSDELNALWGCVLDAHEGCPLDYDACLLALGGPA